MDLPPVIINIGIDRADGGVGEQQSLRAQIPPAYAKHDHDQQEDRKVGWSLYKMPTFGTDNVIAVLLRGHRLDGKLLFHRFRWTIHLWLTGRRLELHPADLREINLGPAVGIRLPHDVLRSSRVVLPAGIADHQSGRQSRRTGQNY